jgi:hypothetical protein
MRRENRDLRLISSHVTVTPEPLVTWAHDVFGILVERIVFTEIFVVSGHLLGLSFAVA